MVNSPWQIVVQNYLLSYMLLFTFDFCILIYYQLNVTPALNKNGMALNPRASKNFLPVIF